MKKIDTMSAATNIKLESNTNHTNNIASNSANNPHNLTSNEKIAHYNNLIYSIDNSNDLFIKDKDSNTILIALSNYKCYIKTLQANSDAKNPVKPYTLKTTLKPNQIYSCFGIKLWQNIKTHKLQQTQSNKSKEIISIKFNGKTLQILEKGEAKQEFTFKAQSGDNVNKETMIEEGNYYIKANEVIEANIINNVNIDINQFNLGNKYIKLHKNTSDKNIADKNTSNNNTANKNTSNNKTSNKETSNNKTLKDDSFTSKIFNLVKIQSTAYTIHGGKSYGDNKGIDLATQDLAFFKALQKLTNKYKVELENANNEIRVEVGYGKSEIDLRGQTTPNGGKVEWISQFDNGGGTACFDTCKKILVNSGLSGNSASPTTRFQIANENKKLSQSKNQSEYLVIDMQTAKDGIAYLDSELESGYPVLVGVDYEFDRKIKLKNGTIDYPNRTDFTTDHYIVIVGRKYDDKGDLYYLFYDVGTNSINEKQYKAGSNDYNRLYLQNDYSLRGRSQIPSKHFYVVTQIRRNIR